MTLRLPLIALAPIALLAGCNTTAGTLNQGMESVHQPVVRHADYVFDVATDGGVLAPGERERLAGWMGSLGLHYGDTIAMDGGSTGAARDQVAGTAARYGLMLADSLPATVPPPKPGIVRVAVSRMLASVPGCPDHSREYVPDYSQSTSSNFGCAVNANLAAMIARPEDLVRGEAHTGSNDPATSTKAIESYRKATNTGSGALQAASTGGK